jgi:HEAT repeat protein
LEGSDRAAVLLRVENNQVEKLKVYSLQCALDAGGLPFVWLTGVGAEASLAYLKGLPNEGAIFAISQHAGMQATDILIDEAKNNKSAHWREQALFWLAQRAGAKAAAAIVDAITNDPNTEVKKKAVFALSQLPAGEGVPKLIEVASTQRNPEVRKQAFFWLGQSHDERAIRYIEDVLTK